VAPGPTTNQHPAMASNVPASALSAHSAASVLAVGGNHIQNPAGNASGFWYVVVDLTADLQVVANEVATSSSAPPPSIGSLLGNSSYFLFFIAQRISSGQLPQGELSTFLEKAGAGAQLAALEQSVSLLGSGHFVHISYVLAATLNDQDLPGFEESSLWNPSVLNMQFIPLQVDGKTIYAPVQTGTQSSPTMVRAVQSAGMAPSVVHG
jgi:hypothetical protein